MTATPASAFRGDIQGLRAIAVLTVMVGHAGLGPFTGGFVGVDVFFVISGFLITQLLLAEAERSGRVSMTGFYARRARRILPAASVVLVVTVLASLFLLSALDAAGVVRDAVVGGAVRRQRPASPSRASTTSPRTPRRRPIQHYWSLAVEEQFYLVWPLVILLLCSWRFASRLSLRRRLFAAISLISLASLVWSAYRTGQEPELGVLLQPYPRLGAGHRRGLRPRRASGYDGVAGLAARRDRRVRPGRDRGRRAWSTPTRPPSRDWRPRFRCSAQRR